MLRKLWWSSSALLVLLLLCAGTPGVSAQSQPPVFSAGPDLVVLADPAYSSLRIPAPAAAFAPSRNTAGSIVVTFLPAGTQDPTGICSAFPAEAQAAYSFAADIWAAYINTPVTIRISACWLKLPDGALGSAGPLLVANVQGLPKSSRWYPLALADLLTNQDLSPANYAISSRFTSDIGLDSKGKPYGPWYFGTDGKTPFGSYDFTSVVLHEIGHGLGFTGTMQVIGGLGAYGLNGFPSVYDDFTQAADGTPLLNLANNSTKLGAALTSAAFFSGPNANATNGGQRVPLYTPSPWRQGSSYSHLAESFNKTPNALMTFSLNNSEVVHDPGPVTLGILVDIGWPISGGISAPAAPSALTASAVSASQINLSWSDNSSDETGFQIERGTDNVAFSAITTAAANVTSYADGSLTGGTQYFYRVRAVSGTFASADISANAITLGPPPAPSALSARASSDTRIDLSWLDNSNIESGYKIERSEDLGVTWNPLVTTGPNATSYSDLGLGVGKGYQYRVSTTSSQGDSLAAGPVSTTTWAVVNHNFTPLIVR